jgi:hypothetical protein
LAAEHDSIILVPVLLSGRTVLFVVHGKFQLNLPDAPFALLFRLAAALWQYKNGWIETPTLWEEGIIPDPEKHQPFSNLRKLLGEHLGSKEGKHFIENDGTKRYRLSGKIHSPLVK